MRRRLLASVAALLLLLGAWCLVPPLSTVEAAIRIRAVAVLQARLTGTVTLGPVHVRLPGSLVVEDLRIAVDGRPVVVLPRLEVTLAPWPLLLGRVRVDNLALHGLRVRAVDDALGWHVPTPRPIPPLGITVDLRRIVVDDARIEVALPDAPGGGTRHLALDAVSLTAHALLTPARRTVTVEALRTHPRGLAVGDVELHGRGSFLPASGFEIDGVTLQTPRSRLTVAGRLNPGRTADARLELGPLAAHDVHAVLPTSRLLADVAGTLAVRGPWSALAVGATAELGAGGTLAATGTVDLAGSRPRWIAGATFAGLDPGAAVAGLVRAHAGGRARGRGRGRAVSAGVGLHDSTVAGTPVVHARLTGRSARGVLRGHCAAVGPTGAVVGRARVRTHGEPTYRVDARIGADDLAALRAGLAGQVEARVALRGRGRAVATRHATVDATLIGADVAGVRLDGGTLRATLDGERSTIDTLVVTGPGVRAEGRGVLDPGRRTVEATLDASADLAAVRRNAARPLTGGTTLHAVVAGTPDAPTIELQLTGTDVGGPHFGLAALRVDARGTLLGPSAGGTLGLAAHGLTAAAGSAREATATLAWRHTPGGLAATLDALSLVPAGAPAWHLARPAAATLADGLRIDGLVLESGTQRLTLDGRVGRRGPVAGTLAATDVGIAPLCELTDTGSCDGQLTGTVRLTGTAAAPQLSADARLDRLAAGGVAYGTLETHLAYADRSAAVRAVLHAPAAGELVLDGTLPVDLAWDGSSHDLRAAPLALALRTQRLQLGFLVALAPAQLRDPRGVLTADVRLLGTRAAPRLEGSATLAGGRVGLLATGVTYEDVTAELRAATGTLDLVALHARTEEGTIAADGHLVLDGLRPGALAVTIHLSDFTAVDRPAVTARVGATLSLEGTLATPLLRGDVLVSHAVFRPSLMPSSGVREVRDPTIAIVGLPAEPPLPAPFRVPGIGLALKVRLGRDAWLRRTDADIALGGELHISRRLPDPLHVDGRIHLVRGWYNFQGRRFQVEEGTVTFGLPGRDDPVVDVRATYRGAEYLVVVHVGGTLKEPALTLSSDPPLEEADVLAVVLFGKPVNALARGESVALERQTVSLGTGFVMPDLRASVLSALGISTLDVEMPPESQTGGATPTPGMVRVGSYVSDDLFVSLAQEFGARTGQVFGIEYALRPRLSVKLSTSTRGSNAIDAFWHRRY